MADIKNELITGAWKALTGFATYLLIILLSVVGMIGNNMYIGKKLSIKQSIGLAILAFCSTLITGIICYNSTLGLTGYIITGIVPYICDKFVLGLMAVDWSKNVKDTLRDWLKGAANKLK